MGQISDLTWKDCYHKSGWKYLQESKGNLILFLLNKTQNNAYVPMNNTGTETLKGCEPSC